MPFGIFWGGLRLFCDNHRSCISEIWDLFMSFGTIFWDVILGLYYDIFGWKIILIFDFWLRKKTVMNQEEVSLLDFNPKILYYHSKIPSENNYSSKGHEQAFALFIKIGFRLSSQLSCSWHQSTKPWILFFPFFSIDFSQFEQLKKTKNNFQWKVCFLFQLLRLRTFWGKNWGKQDSWFGGLMSRVR